MEKEKRTAEQIESDRIQIEVNKQEIRKAQTQIDVWEKDVKEQVPIKQVELEIRKNKNKISFLEVENKKIEDRIKN